MLFNSLSFLIFLPIVFGLYYFILNRSLKLQNTLILVCSYIFYGWWDWRFLSLIAFSTIIDYLVALQMAESKSLNRRRVWLACSLVTNLGLLGFFKYYNFFALSFQDIFLEFGYEMDITTLNIILPVGISFYTFQTLSYSIDVFKNKIVPTKDFIAFSAFVSFFPQLVAGPIERASHLLPQILSPRRFSFDFALSGMKLILYGFFKKVVIADNLAPHVNRIFENHEFLSGSVLLLGAIFFAIQIYGDFSGYSDIAIGLSRLFGIDLMTNFRFPYFSQNIAEFWRRWHISLSTWFRDYVFIPLGGSRVSKIRSIRNIFIVFIISGFWHGANWTFIAWGGIHAVLYIPLFLFDRHKGLDLNNRQSISSNVRKVMNVCITFFFVVLGWVFFRAENVSDAISYLSRIRIAFPDAYRLPLVIIVVPFMILELVIFNWQQLRILNKPLIRYSSYLISSYLILHNFDKSSELFIYFQF